MNKKVIFTIFAMASFSNVYARPLILGDFDQEKLGELLDKLPPSVSIRSVSKLRNFFRVTGTVVSLQFPKKPSPYRMSCDRTFIADSPYPSSTKCYVNVNPLHASAIRQNDVVRFIVDNPNEVDALYEAIPYGMPVKKLYSYGRDQGITFGGTEGTVFHYQFLCSEKDCKLNFSEKALLDK